MRTGKAYTGKVMGSRYVAGSVQDSPMLFRYRSTSGLSSRGRAWQCDPERASANVGVFETETTAAGFNRPLGNRQAESRSTNVGRLGLSGPVVAIENARSHFGSNPRPCV